MKLKPPIKLTEQEMSNLAIFVDDISFFTDRVFDVEVCLIVAGKKYIIRDIIPQKDQPPAPRNPLGLPYNVIAAPAK